MSPYYQVHKDGTKVTKREMKEQENKQEKWKKMKGTNSNNLEYVKEEAQNMIWAMSEANMMAHNMRNWTTHKEINVNTWWVDFSNDKVSFEW